MPPRKISSVGMSARVLVQRRMGDLRSAACGSVGRPATTRSRDRPQRRAGEIENWPLKNANCNLTPSGLRPLSISNLQWLIFNLQFAIPISSIPPGCTETRKRPSSVPPWTGGRTEGGVSRASSGSSADWAGDIITLFAAEIVESPFRCPMGQERHRSCLTRASR